MQVGGRMYSSPLTCTSGPCTRESASALLFFDTGQLDSVNRKHEKNKDQQAWRGVIHLAVDIRGSYDEDDEWVRGPL